MGGVEKRSVRLIVETKVGPEGEDYNKIGSLKRTLKTEENIYL